MMTCPMLGSMGSGMWVMMLLVGFGGLLFLVAIGVGIYLVAKRLRKDDAVMVLRRRLAEGEVTQEEFQRALDILKR
jgi:uncharacterized membrane protein